MNISKLNIYPLNEVNLKALLTHFFPQLVAGDVDAIYHDIRRYNLTLLELEFCALRILPFITKIESMLGENLTQSNALSYSIEIILNYYSEEEVSPERSEIIKMIKDLIGIDEDYENLLSLNHRMMMTRNWN